MTRQDAIEAVERWAALCAERDGRPPRPSALRRQLETLTTEDCQEVDDWRTP